MKKEKENEDSVKFSDELEHFLVQGCLHCQNQYYTHISVEAVLCELLSTYRSKIKKNADEQEFESYIIKRKLENLTDAEFSEFNQSLTDLATKIAEENFKAKNNEQPQKIVFSELLRTIVEAADKFIKQYNKAFHQDDEEKITITELLRALLINYEDLAVVKLFNKYNINLYCLAEEKFTDVAMTTLREEIPEVATLKLLSQAHNALPYLLGKKKFMDEEDEGNDDDDNDDDREDDENRRDKQEEFAAAVEEFEMAGAQAEAVSGFSPESSSNTPTLDQFAINMNAKALSNSYDPVIGRDKEIAEIIKILSCRVCNNPLLLGDPGCGKTAIVEYLASLIAAGDKSIPLSLRNKKLYNLDVTSIVAGCMYRGQFEERMQKIIKEVTEAGNIIVYIDEIHNIVGAGSSGQQEKGDMANILKPFLSRGEFQCIGSTTVAEFRKVIEKDKALVRRFDTVYVNEPSKEETIDIIKGISSKYEDYHKVNYTEEAIKACVELSDRYIYDSSFPAKAVKILDKIGANTKVSRPIDCTKVNEIKKNIDDLEKQKLDIVLNDFNNWSKADEIKDSVTKLKKNLIKAESELENNASLRPEVTVEDVNKVISAVTGVPVDRIKSTEMDKIREMKSQLENKVVGQEAAIKELSLALQQNVLGLRDPKKPIASFLFVGPTGVGKTFIAKTVAEEFFGSEKNLVTIACSEYMQDWAESKLLGSAPGYVGYESTEPRLYILKRQPYTVLLIDEIEKSSNNLYNIWLNMLEEGEITLSSGEKISCRNCIIIFTGNVGTKSLELKGVGVGFGKLEGEEKKKADVATVMKEVEKEFRPEFLNRLSKIVVFNSLGQDELKQVFDLELKKLQSILKTEGRLDVKVTKKLRDFIVSKCEPKYGARSLKRLINEHIQKVICEEMLNSDVANKKKVTVDLKNEKVEATFK